MWQLGVGEDLLRLLPQGVRTSPALAAAPHPRVGSARSTGEALSSRSGDLSAGVEFVKTVAIAFARLRRGDIAGVRLVGLAGADPERRTLAVELIEDHREILGPDVAWSICPSTRASSFSATTEQEQWSRSMSATSS